MKKISVIVPVYKVEAFLPRCLDSLVNQTLEDIEIICINDGSPDNCLNILKDYKKKYGDKIVIIDKKNEGVWRGRFDGVKKATGEYIGFVDSDDYVALNYAEKLYSAAKISKSDIVVCGFDRIDMETQKLYSREMCKHKSKIIEMNSNPEDILFINGAPWNKIFKSEVLKEMKNLKNPPRILDDMMFHLLAYLNTNKITFISDSLIYYMVRPNSIITTIKKDHIDSTYNAMLEIKEIYEQSKNKEQLIPVLDVMAYLHLGISLMYRLSYDKNCNLKETIKSNTKFLDKNFTSWRNSKYIKFSYIASHNFKNTKLLIVRNLQRAGLFRVFLFTYRLIIDKLKIDIKW